MGLRRRQRASAEELDAHFDTSHLHDDLGGRSVRGGGITMVAQGGKFGLQIASTVILARLLMPEDFGLYAMVLVVTTFIGLFKDMGLSWATVQQRRLTHAQVSTLFWINVAVSVVLACVVVAVAPLVASVYDEPRLALVTPALGLSFVFAGLGAQHLALLRRQMRYGLIGTIEVAALASGVVAAIGIALAGGGFWALVAMQVLNFAVMSSLSWLLTGWRPGRPHRHAGVREMVSFGSHLTGFNFLNYFTRQADKALLGWFVGAGALGFYVKAYNLFSMPMHQINGPLNAVAIPALSRLQEQPEDYRAFYRKAVTLIAYGSIPTVALLAVLSPTLIPFVLGEQWTEAAPIFQFLAIAGVGAPILWTAGWVHQSLGRTDRMLRWSLVSDPLYVLSFVIGLPWGPRGVALSFAVCINLLWLPTLAYAYRGSSVSVNDLLQAVKRPIGVALAVVAVAWFLHGLMVDAQPLARLAVTIGGAGTTVAVLLLLWSALRREVGELLAVARHLRRSNEPTDSPEPAATDSQSTK